MAGTRLFLVIVYLVQISIIVLTSVSNSLKGRGKSTWYNYRNHQSILPVRSGTLLLADFQTTLNNLKSLISSTTVEVRVELCFSDGAFSEEEQVSTLSFLEDAFSELNNTTRSLKFILRPPISKDTEKNRKNGNLSNVYQLYFSLDEMLSEIQYHAKLDVDDEGQMLFRVKSGLHRDDYYHLIRNDLTFHLKYMLLNNDVVSIPATEITVTLVDSDPLSHMPSNENSNHVINHQTTLKSAFMHEMNKTLSKMVYSRLNLYRHFGLRTQTYKWLGFDLTTNAQEMIDSNGNRQHVLHTDIAAELLMGGDLSKLMHGSIVPLYKNFGLPESINCILFIPTASCTPLFFINAGKESEAIILERKHTILSIANIDQSADQLDDFGYSYGLHKSLSLIGGFIRQIVGLHELRREYTIGKLHVYYEHGYGGIRLWEIENLIRGSFHSDAIKVVESLERVFDLILVRNHISVSLDTSQRIINCADILHQALNSITSESDNLFPSHQLINDALVLSSQIVSDDELFELPHTPPDQVFAVFGSLLLPLSLVLIKNLATEAKRYRSLNLKAHYN